MDGLDHARLLQATARGDHSAFETLVRHWEGPLQRFLVRLVGNAVLAEDARQLTFLRIYTRATQYRGGSAKSWIFRVAYSVGLNVRRGESRRAAETLELHDLLADEAATPDVDAVFGEQRDAVRVALDRLDDSDRTLLWLRVAEDLSVREIGRVLDQPPSTLRYRLVRALDRFRKELKPLLGNGEPHAVP